MGSPIQKSENLIRDLFEDKPFRDSYLENENNSVDVVIPILHGNDLWRENLKSFFREIPIRRLLIGDAGCVDGSIQIAMDFPRVKIYDHTSVNTLGKSLALLIEEVESENFIYLQSDVYLPDGWYDKMSNALINVDWVGCPMQIVVMLDYFKDLSGRRPLAGAQMGKKHLFNGIADYVLDDYVYRQEDFVLEHFVRKNGGTSGGTTSTFHFHQQMRRKTIGQALDVKEISIELFEKEMEKKRFAETQLFGFLKYCIPDSWGIISFTRIALREYLQCSSLLDFKPLAFARLSKNYWTFLICTEYLFYYCNLFLPKFIENRLRNLVSKFIVSRIQSRAN